MDNGEILIHNGGKPFSYHKAPYVLEPRAIAFDETAQIRNKLTTSSDNTNKVNSRCARVRRPALARHRLSLASYRRIGEDCDLTIKNESETAEFGTGVECLDVYKTLRTTPKLGLQYYSKTTTNTKRLYVAQELLHSEQKYVDMLLMLQTVFIVPLMISGTGTTAILSPASMSAIFANFIDILHISAELLALLQDRLDPLEHGIQLSWNPDSGSVGDILCQVGHYFKMYKTYCRNFNSAIAVLETELKSNQRLITFLSQAHIQHALAGMSLQSYLLLPVQRIPRYKLLIAELTKRTPMDHPDYMPLKEAGLIVSDAATDINEAIRHHEMWQQLMRLQMCFSNLDEPLTASPSRILLKQGTITKICRKSHQLRELFLFNDCLIIAIAIPLSPVLNDDSRHFVFNRHFNLQSLAAERHGQAYASQNHLWRLVSPSKSFLAYNETDESRSAWVKAIMDAKADYIASIPTRRVLHSGQSTLQLTHGKVRSQIRFPGLSMLATSFVTFPTTEYPILRNHVAPVWVEDSSALSCQRCSIAFSFFRGRHHCRICGFLVCASCSGKRFLTSSKSEALRACSACYVVHFTEMSSAGKSPCQVLMDDGSMELDVPPMNLDTFRRSTRRMRALRDRRLSVFELSPPMSPTGE